MIGALHIALRFVALSTMALLLYSAGAMADCIKPAWPDLVSLKHAASEKGYVSEHGYQTRVHEFIVCQRSSLEKRASGLEASAMRQIILRDRAAEDRSGPAFLNRFRDRDKWKPAVVMRPAREAAVQSI